MPDQEVADLLKIGPFGSLDTRTAQPFADTGTLAQISNGNAYDMRLALNTGRGRIQATSFAQFGAFDIVQIAVYVVSPVRLFIIAQNTQGVTLYSDIKQNNPALNTQGTLPFGVDDHFTQSVQSNGILWLNNGYQVFLNNTNTLSAAPWQYPQPDGVAFNYTVGQFSGGVPLEAGTYSYAFVQEIKLPNADGTVDQFTTPNGVIAKGTDDQGNSVYPFRVVNNGTASNQVSGIFAGTTDQGYPFVTRLYRFSSNSPNWYFVTTLTTNGIYIDGASDQSISGNAQLAEGVNFNQDPPPTGHINGYPPNPIAAHQDRMWVMAIIRNVGTNNYPQTQVWYSRTGQPWSFDAVNQALLVEDEDTVLQGALSFPPAPIPLPDLPTALESLGATLLCFRRATTSAVYGVDQSTYQCLKLFSQLGCVAENSVVSGGGLTTWAAHNGIWAFDGNTPQWLWEQESPFPTGVSQWFSMQSAFAGSNFYYSLPGGLTYSYYIPDKMWSTLPYNSPSIVSLPSAPSDMSGTPLTLGMLVAARETSTLVDFWEADYQDFNETITATILTQETDSAAPTWEKKYKFIVITAPYQVGVTVNVRLIVDGALVQEWNDIDLGPTLPGGAKRGYSIVKRITGRWANGYFCQLGIDLTNTLNATGPAILYAARVVGSQGRNCVVKD